MDSMVWWGSCQDCEARYIVARDEELPNPEEWEAFPSCFVCDGSVSIEGSDREKDILR